MNIKEHKKKAEKAINELKNLISNDEIMILEKNYTVAKLGKWHLQLIGARGAKYMVGTAPESKVLGKGNEDKNVFFIVGSKTFHFTIFNKETILL